MFFVVKNQSTLSSSQRSHATALFHSRMTVRVERSSTSAISSSFKPAKHLISTIRHLRGCSLQVLKHFLPGLGNIHGEYNKSLVLSDGAIGSITLVRLRTIRKTEFSVWKPWGFGSAVEPILAVDESITSRRFSSGFFGTAIDSTLPGCPTIASGRSAVTIESDKIFVSR